MDAYGADNATPIERISDYRRAQIRAWWVAKHPGTEITVAQQFIGMVLWAQKGGDLTLAAILDGTLH